MPNAENAKLMYESSQSLVDYAALTDAGSQTVFNSADNYWSNKSGKEASVRPNGLITGGAVTPGVSGLNDKIDVAALTCYLAGVEISVAASADEDVVRGLTTDVCRINSVTVNSAGSIAIVSGADHTAFSTTRGADGGPPWIPTGSIEIAQVRFTSVAAAVVSADEIKADVGTHLERYDTPVWETNRINVENQTAGYAGIEFNEALPLIHSDDSGSTTAAKKVYARYYTPSFAEVPRAENFVAPENSHSVSSKQVYGSTIGSSSSSLGQGSFTAYPNDGITDSFLTEVDSLLIFKFLPDRLKAPYLICQGKLGVTGSFPAGDSISVACTISAESVGERVAS